MVIQKTHWHETSDFHSGPWLVMHTSGRSSPDGFGRCAGILFLLRKQQFQDPRILDINPGCQHVWRSGLSTTRNLELRRGLWTQLDQVLLTMPARHHLLVCGDFNSAVSSERHSVLRSAANPDDDLQALLHKHSLCMLNTWHSRPSSTFYSPTGETQIDFVITRQGAANFQAKRAYPDHLFPVGAGRLSGHYPVRAQLPMLHSTISPCQLSLLPGHLVTEHAMRIHCSLKHEAIPRLSSRTPTIFTPELLAL